MSIYSISCKDHIPTEEDEKVISIDLEDNSEYKETLEIQCDGKEDNNSFVVSNYGDEGIIIKRNRCFLEIYIKENQTPYSKVFNIICTHSNDQYVIINIRITQPPYKDFTIETEEIDEIIFETTPKLGNQGIEGDEIFYEQKSININVKGGSKKYKIVNIFRCHYENDDLEKGFKRQNFDNGFVLKKEKDKITLKSYGKPFLENNDYYEINLQHFDLPEVKKTIRIKYKNEQENEVVRKIASQKEIIIQEENNSIPLETENIELVENNIQKNNTVKEKNYSIKFLQDITNYTILDNPIETILPFIVKEGRRISDLMTMATSTAKWCEVKVIEEYNSKNKIKRKLIFIIKDKPKYERRSLITLNIIDKPEIFVEFILINKPSKE